MTLCIRDHPFSTYTKCSNNLAFLTPWLHTFTFSGKFSIRLTGLSIDWFLYEGNTSTSKMDDSLGKYLTKQLLTEVLQKHCFEKPSKIHMKIQTYILSLYWKGTPLSMLIKLSEKLFNRVTHGDTNKGMTLVV